MLVRSIKNVAVVFGMVALLATPVLAETYEIDNAHSGSTFRVKHRGVSYVHGAIPDLSGVVKFNPEKSEGSSIEVTAKVASLSTFVEGRDEHLSGPDFFNAKQFPVITFKSASWKKKSDNMYEVVGNFTMLGVTKSITVEAEHVGMSTNRDGESMTGFEATVTIDRTDFGMNYGVSEDDSGLGAIVDLAISVECIAE